MKLAYRKSHSRKVFSQKTPLLEGLTRNYELTAIGHLDDAEIRVVDLLPPAPKEAP